MYVPLFFPKCHYVEGLVPSRGDLSGAVEVPEGRPHPSTLT